MEFHLNNLEEDLKYNRPIDEGKELYKGKDKKNKVIDDCLYLTTSYTRVEKYFDTVSITKLRRDGSAWGGGVKDTFRVASSKEDELVDYFYNLINEYKKKLNSSVR